MEHAKRVGQRRHIDKLKVMVLNVASLAQVALVHDMNVDLVHKWRRRAEGVGLRVAAQEIAKFIPVTAPGGWDSSHWTCEPELCNC